MPTGPNGEKRPADAVGCAVDVMREATGQERLPPVKQTQPSSERRSEIARKATKARRSA